MTPVPRSAGMSRRLTISLIFYKILTLYASGNVTTDSNNNLILAESSSIGTVSSSNYETSTAAEILGQNSSCGASEHRCLASGACIAADKFCDGENDCEDKSDEPALCTR